MRIEARIALSILLVAASTALGCGGSSSKSCSPVGNWNVTLTWGAGNCGETGTIGDQLTVTAVNASTYNVNDGVAGDTTTGTWDTGSCTMSAETTFSGTANNGDSVSGTIDRNYKLSGSAVSGTGSFAADDATAGTSCSQQFTAAGTKS